MYSNAQPLRAKLVALALTWLPLAAAQAATPAEQPYTGSYTQGSVDSRAQLMLLDDNTFCFGFMGGSLDMLAGGRWKAEGNGVRLQEVRLNGTVFPVFGKAAPEQETVEFDFHGHSLSRAASVAFATGADEALPTSLRRLFKDGHNGWSSSYKLPPMPVAQVRYFYIADAEVDADRQPRQLRVVQYRRGDANALRVGYNRAFGIPPLNLFATLKDEVLYVDGSRFGARKELPEKALERIRATCITPVLADAKRPAEGGSEEEAAARRSTAVKSPPLVPVKTFYLPLTALQGTPYFSDAEK